MTQSHTVLLVEDEAPAAMALGDALTAQGYTVTHAADGQEGLRLALENHPDMMLLDLRLPKMTGIQVLEALRKDEWGKTAKVIVLTNASDLDTLQSVMDKGTFHYLTKADTSVADVCAVVAEQLKPKN